MRKGFFITGFNVFEIAIGSSEILWHEHRIPFFNKEKHIQETLFVDKLIFKQRAYQIQKIIKGGEEYYFSWTDDVAEIIGLAIEGV